MTLTYANGSSKQVSFVDLPALVGLRLKNITFSIHEIQDAIRKHGQEKVISYLTTHLSSRLLP